MIKIGILGYGGRMGQAIAQAIAENGTCKVVGGADKHIKPELAKAEGILVSSNIDEVVAISDVVIDFTLADAVSINVQSAVKHKKAYVCGVTGISAEQIEALKQASKTIPVLYTANMSLSLAAMKQIVKLATKLLGNYDYDIAILDEHHRMKKDAPSGTAKALGDAVTETNGGKKQPTYSATRAGYIVGNHEVAFVGNGEVIRLHHSVTDRGVFARGAVQAALWLSGQKPGFYNMDDVLKI
ncbi:MAG TPA: 4-hydroxy-tetrahydrodipicolinate reductase [Alphaproteobacteria bacterium]|nr:4-hydroxy-tetrahydrodipicolinate reductase [Alphaproteobacteria bacterium]